MSQLPFSDAVVGRVLATAVSLRLPQKEPTGDFGPFEAARTVDSLRALTDEERRAAEWLTAQCQALLALSPKPPA